MDTEIFYKYLFLPIMVNKDQTKKGYGMTIQMRVVTVMQVPEDLDVKKSEIFFKEIQDSMSVDRPRLVLDCANLGELNKPTIHLLLCCLEEAMKRNGDVKLAALPPGSQTVLEETGIGRLFDIYDTATEAFNSFHQSPGSAMLYASAAGHTHRELEDRD